MTAWAWFLARTPRERALIAGAAVLALCLALWFASGAARQVRHGAEAEWLAAEATLEAAQRLKARGASGRIGQELRDEAEQSGLGVEIAESGDQIDLTVAAARTTALLPFLAELDTGGLGPSAFTVVENADATLQMSSTFRAPANRSP
jgi:type II secretory pathway component PulM